jgi:hypothetical protein
MLDYGHEGDTWPNWSKQSFFAFDQASFAEVMEMITCAGAIDVQER